MRPARTILVSVGGYRYQVAYADDGRALGVLQEIIPLRHKPYWRSLNPVSPAFRNAVRAADRKAAQTKP